MKQIRKWYNNLSLNKKTQKLLDVDTIGINLNSMGDDEKVSYLEGNFEFYEKYGKDRFSAMLILLRDKLESNELSEKDTARLRGSILAYRSIMTSFELMPSEIENIKTKGKNIQEKIININNFNK